MPDKNDSTYGPKKKSRVTVKWSDSLIRHMSTKGRTFEPGENITVTAGLPEDAELVEATLSPDHYVEFVFETDQDPVLDEVRVEHSVEFRYGTVPVEAIRTALVGLNTHFVENEGRESLRILDQWFQEIDKGGR